MVNSINLLERLKQKSAYEKFNKDYPENYLYALFCLLSEAEKEGDKIQFDFYVPKENKIAIADYPFDEIKVSTQEINPAPSKLSLNEVNLDFEHLKQEIRTIQEKNSDKTKINKIMAILKEDKWHLTCMSETIDILKIKIDAKTKECLEFKKENLMNFVQIRKKN